LTVSDNPVNDSPYLCRYLRLGSDSLHAIARTNGETAPVPKGHQPARDEREEDDIGHHDNHIENACTLPAAAIAVIIPGIAKSVAAAR